MYHDLCLKVSHLEWLLLTYLANGRKTTIALILRDALDSYFEDQIVLEGDSYE